MALLPFSEEINIQTPTVGCDGGGGSLGHPLVYLTVTADGTVSCPYCSQRFVLKSS